MLDKFTEKALKAVIVSQQEAKRLSHYQIGTEHLLLGLMAEGTGIPIRVLKAVGVTLEALRRQVKLEVPKIDESSKSTEISFSVQAIKALKLATDKAKALGYIYVGSEHIFIALLSSEKFGSVQVLKDMDVDLTRIKETVTRITVKRSLNRAHPEIQSSKKLTEITKAIQSKFYDIPFTLEDETTTEVINLAKEEMQLRGNDTIGTEHLMLALTKSENTSLKLLLEEEGINYQKLEEYLTNNSNRIGEYEGVNYQLTPVAYTTLESAYEISTNLGYGVVKPEHILLGMLKEDKGKVLEILRGFSIEPKSLYKKIIYPIEKQKPPTLSIIKLAKEEARRLEYNVVGTEHILLGLLCVGIGIASQVLTDLGITLKDARQEVENLIGYGSSDYSREMTFTPRAKRLLEIAWEEAKKLGEKHIESEHLLLAIIRLKDCMAMGVLAGLGVDSIEIKQGVMSAMEEKKKAENP